MHLVVQRYLSHYYQHETANYKLLENKRLTKKNSTIDWQNVNYFWREVLVLLLLVCGVFYFIALISHSPSDAIWSEGKDVQLITNTGGVVGAWLADVSFKLFGWSVFIVPITLLSLAWRLHRRTGDEKKTHWALLVTRVICFIFLLCFSAAFFCQNASESSAGWVGCSVHHLFSLGFGDAALLIYLSVILLCFSVTANVSIVRLFYKSGSYLFFCASQINDYLKEKKEQRHIKKQAQQAKKDRLVLHKKSHTQEKPNITMQPKPQTEKPKQAPAVQPFLFETQTTITRPSLSLLSDSKHKTSGFSKEALEALSRQLELKLKDFGFDVNVETIMPGPVVTQFELSLAAGVKVSQIAGLSKDLARALLVESVRILDVIPGKPVIGIEIPNATRQIIFLKTLLSSDAFQQATSPLTVALGENVNGEPVFADLSKMPHLLVAGATGMGKSVSLNAMILSVLYKSTPEQVRIIMIDPKVVELAAYADIPHLLTPVITNMNQAANALRWGVQEMERRYQLLSSFNVRNIAGFNKKALEAKQQGQPLLDPLFNVENASEDEKPAELEPLPLIMVVIDEYADMLSALAQEEGAKAKKIEGLIVRLAQKARAAGIHLIIATQRPSVDVITGLIKSNIPTRIAFKVTSKIDSRTILDQGGAEQLLGLGDMLYTTPGAPQLTRLHGAFVDDDEVVRITSFMKKQCQPNYVDSILNQPNQSLDSNGFIGSDEADECYDAAVQIVTRSRRASISSIQRQLRIGYNRAARLVEMMESQGVVSAIASNGQREVLAPPPIED